MIGKASVTGKMVLAGKLVLQTPLIIGGGSDEQGESDIVVLKDELGMPYIPGTSMAGCFRHHFFRSDWSHKSEAFKQHIHYFWGTSPVKSVPGESHESKGFQSQIRINDAYLSADQQAKIGLRDGVKIDSKTGIAEEKMKFNYECVEPEVSFDFRMECTIRGFSECDSYRYIMAWLKTALTNGEIRLGAMTGKGFGRCRLEDPHFYEFNFNKPSHVLAWLKNDVTAWPLVELNSVENPSQNSKTFSIEAYFSIKNSLIIRSYAEEISSPDAVHISRGNQALMPGTSVRGAIRARAERIILTLNGSEEEFIHPLFGWVPTPSDDKEQDAIRGKIIVEETVIDSAYLVREIQKRIRIDRFTGGAMKGGLFDSLPLWKSGTEGQEMVQIKLTIEEYQPWEAGLLLLVLKDLWNGDLAIGGERSIGRGTLQGIKAVISFEDREIILNERSRPLVSAKDAAVLEDMLQHLLDEIELRSKEVSA